MIGSKAVVGAVAGVVFALGALAVIGTGDSENPAVPAGPDSTLPTTSTTAAPVPWIAEGEVVFESTVLIPTSFDVEDGEVKLDFELQTLSPMSASDGNAPRESIVDALPERWAITVVSGGGTVVETDPGASAVRFDMRSGLTAEHIESIRLIGWRAAVPVDERITVTLEEGATGEFQGGTTVSVATILTQANSLIVQLDVDQPYNEWNRIDIDAADPNWRESGRIEGGLQYIWDRGEPPAVLELVQATPAWIPVEGSLVVFGGTES